MVCITICQMKTKTNIKGTEKMNWKEKDRIRKTELKNESHKDENGVWRYNSNDHVPPSEVLECWGLDKETMELCNQARENDTQKFLAKYRKQMENHVPSDKEMFEMQAAFGKGAQVVNVLTGKKIQL